ncbi:hypothetical protein [Hydrogenimonas urashimensis]|uniref:hypothetical protein n=1 Tax=Hydrogenimonas urashimensis TaxID=2740515 RepID=UPI001915FFFC|nr:hypothetical protein [Hydrogenimonas urashimensis]
MRGTLEHHIPGGPLKSFIKFQVRHALGAIQQIRNEAAHGESTSFGICRIYRNKIVGIGESGIVCDLVRYQRMIEQL